MMGRLDELRHILRKDEYSAEEAKINALNESAADFHQSITAKYYDKQAPLRRMRNKCAFTKEIICECMCNLFESALVLDEDDVKKYSNSFRKAMKDECMSIMEGCHTNSELETLFENASPYIQEMLVLAEEAYGNKTDEEVKEFENKVLLNKDDLNLINKFEAEQGKDVYATTLQDRVIDVYKAEEQLGKEQNEKVQAVVDELSKKSSTGADGEPMSECIEKGVNLFNTTPKTIFNAIFVNKSKQLMTESASANLEDVSEKVLAETIATYTLLETIHSLGFKTYSDDEKKSLRLQFFIA